MNPNPIAAASAPQTVYIGLGSNLEQPVQQLQSALRELGAIDATELLSVSSFYETTPVGLLDQPMFINAAAKVLTRQTPHDFLRALLAIEQGHARVRKEKNGPRTLDLDVLMFADLQLNDADLITPHPRMHERAFVLVPLLEIAPALTIPGKGSVRAILQKIGDAGVRKLASGKPDDIKQDKIGNEVRR